MPQLGGRMLGASGAVTAVLVLFAMHFPTRIFYFMLVIPMPVIRWSCSMSRSTSWGWSAEHAAGSRWLAISVERYSASFTTNSIGGFLRFWLEHARLEKVMRRQPRLKVYRGESREEPVACTRVVRSAADSELEAELDTVLEKVSASVRVA